MYSTVETFQCLGPTTDLNSEGPPLTHFGYIVESGYGGRGEPPVGETDGLWESLLVRVSETTGYLVPTTDIDVR